jgi:hypothetical protein
MTEKYTESTPINQPGFLGSPSAKVMSDRMLKQQDPYQRKQHPTKIISNRIPNKLPRMIL